MRSPNPASPQTTRDFRRPRFTRNYEPRTRPAALLLDDEEGAAPLKAATRRAVLAESVSVWCRERGRKEVLLSCLTLPGLHLEGGRGLSGAERQEKRAGGLEGSSSPPYRQQPPDRGGDRAAPAQYSTVQISTIEPCWTNTHPLCHNEANILPLSCQQPQLGSASVCRLPARGWGQ